MNSDEIYGMVPGVMTPEEEEDWHHDPCDDIIDTTPSWYNMKMLMNEPARPEACSRREFEARKPALGLSLAEVDELEAHEKLEDLLPVQRRNPFSLLRSALLRHLIPCDGCSTVAALCGGSSAPKSPPGCRRQSPSGTCTARRPWAPERSATITARTGAASVRKRRRRSS